MFVKLCRVLRCSTITDVRPIVERELGGAPLVMEVHNSSTEPRAYELKDTPEGFRCLCRFVSSFALQVSMPYHYELLRMHVDLTASLV